MPIRRCHNNHRHLRPRLVAAQVAYAASAAAGVTARAIVRTKLRNCRLLLSNYSQARDRNGSAQARILQQVQRQIFTCEQQVPETPHRQALFLLEGRAARAYWQAIALLCHRPPGWRRVYPHAKDSLNLLLNIGYTQLMRRVTENLVAVGLLPELGVLHGETSGGEALTYDLMECFRQPAVDAVVIPLFSRQRIAGREAGERGLRAGVARIYARWDQRFPYRGRCERLEHIVRREAVRLRQTMLTGMAWQPYHHRWGHSWRCR